MKESAAHGMGQTLRLRSGRREDICRPQNACFDSLEYVGLCPFSMTILLLQEMSGESVKEPETNRLTLRVKRQIKESAAHRCGNTLQRSTPVIPAKAGIHLRPTSCKEYQ